MFVDFSKAFDSIYRRKDDLPKETFTAVMMLYRNTKVKVRLQDGDTHFFDIITEILQGDTSAPYLYIICLDYEL